MNLHPIKRVMLATVVVMFAGTLSAAEPAAAAAPKAKASGDFCATHKAQCAHYKQCLSENLADAKAYCANHPDGCDAESKAAESVCRDEALGKKLKG